MDKQLTCQPAHSGALPGNEPEKVFGLTLLTLYLKFYIWRHMAVSFAALCHYDTYWPVEGLVSGHEAPEGGPRQAYRV